MHPNLNRIGLVSTFVWFVASSLTVAVADEPPTAADAKSEQQAVSFYQHIRPLVQAHCQGCHQPAKPQGDYVMTTYEQLIKGGESGDAAVVPGQPDDSYLIDQITPVDGEAAMPQGKPPLSADELKLFRTWIAQGAHDDTPENAGERFDRDHPPTYVRPQVITALDYSPDGSKLAISGFHEVLLFQTANWEPAGRLIGMSARIESIQFSPDGKWLAVTGGRPSRTGEVQVWNAETNELQLSIPVTFDTVYGASWSPDSKLIAFGCSDTTVRVIEAETGKQVLYQGAHNDWVLDTVFSAKGTHVISVGRDMTVKLTEVETERFVDNITSITPGALSGGVESVDRHPERDEVLVGGADGIPKLFRVFRTSKRVIGDNANLIREFPPLEGRIFSVDISPDGNQVVAGSSLNGQGQVKVYAYDFDTNIPDDLKKILGKRTVQRSQAEKDKVAAFRRDGVRVLAETSIPASGIYAVRFTPDGKHVAAAGSDGHVRIINSQSGKIEHEFLPVKIEPAEQLAARETLQWRDVFTPDEQFNSDIQLKRITVQPSKVQLRNRFESVQLLITGQLASGELIDLTRQAEVALSDQIVSLSDARSLRPVENGQTRLTITAGQQSVELPVTVSGLDAGYDVDYVRDIMPVISKLGCNAGTCHGAKDGKDGFKLSLRGYDPLYDVRAFTDDHGARRVNLASPDDSLMLLKASGGAPHMGGQLTRPGEPDYEILRQWIATGAQLDLSSARVERIELHPLNPVVQKLGTRQQMRVLAYYTDGTQRDVTRYSFIDSGNTDIAVANAAGLVTVMRRGEAPILARFEGAYAATTVTAMGDRTGFAWKNPGTYNFVDEHVYSKLERMRTLPSELCTDAEFIRRVYIDLTGLPPTSAEVRRFIADERASREKRNELIDQLIGSPEFVEYWTNKWADLLQVNRKYLGAEGSSAFRKWIRERVEKNVPYDQFAYDILTASGSNKDNPAASYYKILRSPAETMENTTHLFLAVRFNCNKCHDHPFERWTQDQYYETAAFFARLGLKKDPQGGDKKIGGTAVEGAKPLYEVVFDKPAGEITHDRTGAVTQPEFPFECNFEAAQTKTRREQLAAWITSPDNQYFASSYVNRVWGYMLGVGLIEPLDDIRAGNPPTNPELLDHLTAHFIDSGFDVRELMRTICRSRTYQHSIVTNRWNDDDTINYSHAIARRLPAEVLYDSIHRVTGAQTKLPGVPAGTRAAELPDAGVKLPNGFLANFGRPARESACECERTSEMQLGPVMALVSGPTLGQAIADPKNRFTELLQKESNDRAVITELYLSILNRPPSADEIQLGIDLMGQLPKEHANLVKTLEEYERELKPIRERLERERTERIAKATNTLKAYEKEIQPREQQADREQQQRIAAARTSLADYKLHIADHQIAWESSGIDQVTRWKTLDPKALSATNGAELKREDDYSIFASGKNGQGAYRIELETQERNITAVRLELLPDSRLPKNGPGRAPDGNFVLTEFVVQAAPLAKRDELKPVKLQNAKADFSQQTYVVKTAIDGNRAAANNGWAASPQLGKRHVASFEFAQKIDHEGGTRLVLELHQLFNSKQHSIGRFRVAVTTSKQPVSVEGLPSDISDIVKIAPAARTIDQRLRILNYFESVDPTLKNKQKELADAQKPRPIDPKLKKLQEDLAYVSLPVPPDARHEELKKAVALSQKQLQNVRRTAVEDLAWALINSPAFLFNH